MKKYIYGVDLGGTSTKMGLFSFDGTLIEQFEIPTITDNNGEQILSDIAQALKDNQKKHSIKRSEIKGIGIGVPGPVTHGVVNRCINLGWDVVDVKTDLEALTGLDVCVSNDANVAGLGELWKGGGEGYQNLIFVTLGTGVGGAVIVEGKIVDGSTGAGGEIGHAPISTDHKGYACNCGKSGCLETVASATGIVRVANDYLKTTNHQTRLSGLDTITAKDVFDLAKDNDPLACEVVDYFAKNLGFVCAILASATNPQGFVFGGGVSKAGSIITTSVQKYFNQFAFYALQETTFNLATLGNDAGIYGAAYLVNQE